MKKLWSGITAFCLCLPAIAQETTIGQKASHLCAASKVQHAQTRMYKTTIADADEDNYDVRHVKLELNMDNTSTAMSGKATTTITTITGISEYAFELNAGLVIDSVKWNGNLLSVISIGGVHKAQFSQTIPAGTTLSIEVYYEGELISSGSNTFGIRNESSPSWGTNVTYTLSQPYDAYDWWPCKQSLRDKLDSADIWITVPDSLKAGSNGVLTQVTSMGNGFDRYEWKTRYAIDYYLLSVAVAPYLDYSYYAPLPNSADSVLVQNYVYGDNPLTFPTWQSEIDSVGLMITYFSELYGKYPFWQEKYGHCMAPISGGMEHQTMTSQGNFSTMLSVHELGHQWFGDHVTCATWKDIWLNEGFASYTEYLFANHFQGATAAATHMAFLHDNVMSDNSGSVYVSDTTDEERIFDSRLSYDKGSAVVHTLRWLINDDNSFFSLLRGYQQQFAFGTATTEDFQQYAETFLNRDLDDFFNQWIYGEGFPKYSAEWNKTNSNDVYIKLNETTSAATTPFFNIPVQVILTGMQGDTMLRLDHQVDGQVFHVNWSKPISNIVIDRGGWLINAIGSITQNATLNVASPERVGVRIYPNPATNAWQVSNLPAMVAGLQLTDMSGRVVWQGNTPGSYMAIPADDLSPGMYLLRISNKQSNMVLKLIKQ